MIGFSFASDWSRGWHEFSGQITEQSKTNRCSPGILSTFKWKLLFYLLILALSFLNRAGRTKNEERALAYANQVYRTTRNKPLAKSNMEERRIRDVFFEQR